MAVYEHDLDAANARIEELETELADMAAAAQAVQKTCDKLRAENVSLTAGKTQGAEAAAKVVANLAAFQAGEL
jgi:predicted  nucleic acid-binding Zn-ribbon protein